MKPSVDSRTSLNISLSYLVQIIAAISIAVYAYATTNEKIESNAQELRNLRGNQNNYIFPDIKKLEHQVIDLEKEVAILENELEHYKKELQELEDDR